MSYTEFANPNPNPSSNPNPTPTPNPNPDPDPNPDQAGRRMAEPNQGFMRQLRALEAAGVFARLHEEWSSTGG